MSRTRILWVALLAALAGCMDQAQDVGQYRRVLGGPAAPATQPAGALTLTGALEMANRHNEQLALSGETYLQALIDKDRAAAAFLPIISLQPSYFRMDPFSVPGLPAGASLGGLFPTETTDVPLNGRMNVFNGFRDAAALQAAAKNIEQRALLLDLQSTLLVEVAGVYYEVLRAERLERVLANSVAVQEDRVRDLQNKQAAGVARPVDVSQAQAQAAATRIQRINAEASGVRGRATLAFLIGVPAVHNPLRDDLTVPAVAGVTELEQIGQQRRQDLAAAVAGVGAAKQAVNAALGEWLPSVSINFNYFLHRESFPSESEWNGLLQANVPIFTAGLIRADVRAAWSRLRQAMLNESLVARQILEDVRIAYEDVQANARKLDESKVQLAAAEAGYRQANEGYKAGVGTNLEVLVAQDQVLQGQVQTVIQDYAHKTAYLTLLRVTGQLGLTAPPGLNAPTTQPVTGETGSR